jgi:hypothetical protein
LIKVAFGQPVMTVLTSPRQNLTKAPWLLLSSPLADAKV